MNAKQRFARRLRAARDRLGLDQAEVARRTGITASQISHFESGTRAPSLENFMVIARKLNVSADYLLGLSNTIGPGGFYSELTGLTTQNREMVRSIIECVATHTQAKDRQPEAAE